MNNNSEADTNRMLEKFSSQKSLWFSGQRENDEEQTFTFSSKKSFRRYPFVQKHSDLDLSLMFVSSWRGKVYRAISG